MTVEEIARLLQAEIVCGTDRSDHQIEIAFASDLMSDVLTLCEDNVMLITGLANTQTIRTAEMAEIPCVIIARDKFISEDMIEIANDNDIILLKCRYSLYKTCGLLYHAGILPVF
jgi:serine kinase of HPr protein (carbohydrate metabolism regulator)